MPLNNYGVLKGWVRDRRHGLGDKPHYHILIVDDRYSYRASVNIRSMKSPAELIYFIDKDFKHPLLYGLIKYSPGFTEIEREPGGEALDYIRANLLDMNLMRPLPHNRPGPDNDLNEKLDAFLDNACEDNQSMIYTFGQKWGPIQDKQDKHFGFKPSGGMHDIHMNQGNSSGFRGFDGVWQDGALIVFDARRQKWSAFFLAFQSQARHTDDKHGHSIKKKAFYDGKMRIVGALVNPIGNDQGRETVTLKNSSSEAINLSGWMIADRQKNKFKLDGTIKAKSSKVLSLPDKVQLGNNGGLITLLDKRGLKVHGVSYIKEQAQREGLTITF
jgi:uncharacterized protein YukJ